MWPDLSPSHGALSTTSVREAGCGLDGQTDEASVVIWAKKVREPLLGRMQMLADPCLWWFITDGCVWNDVIEYAVGAAKDGEAKLGDFGQVIDDLQKNFEGEG